MSAALEVDFKGRAGHFPLSVAFSADAPVTALFGRSGAGKTSIMNALAGLLRPDSGRIVCAGTVLFDSAAHIDVPAADRRIGYVFQDSLLFPHLDVRRNLIYGMQRHQRTAPLIGFDQAVELLALGPLLARAPATLSGGEARRVAIGRALLSAPRLLLLDEPLAALDAGRRNEILETIERLRDRVRLPIVLVSHSVAEVTRLADTMVIVADGGVLATGGVEEVMNRLDLRPHTGRYEAGSVISCTVHEHDAIYGLTLLRFDGGQLELPAVEAAAGERVRVRIRARDVTLATERPARISTRNVLRGTIAAMSDEVGPVIDIALDIGHARLLARVTRRSRDELGLCVGGTAFALIKAISLDRRSAGYA
ncbi:MAG: molybdenum ABC transporter ATP-binding protein [Betaproteobacteria bacterium]